MFVIEVIPLRRGARIDTLSYFSSNTYPIGTILSVLVRTSTALAVVVRVTEVSRTKAALRAATFSLKKLPEQVDTKMLSPALLETARELLQHYPTHWGVLLYALLPPEIRNGDITLPHTHHVDVPATRVVPEVLQGAESERYLAYRSLVRETFAHSGSILFVVPSSAEIEAAREVLGAGIEDRLVVLSSSLTAKELRENYARVEDFSRPKLIIATPSRSLIERHDITLMILEYARSAHYKEQIRPYLDYRDVLQVHAQKTGRRIIYGDMLVRSEEEYARRADQYQTYGETPKRVNLAGVVKGVKMKDTPDGSIPFQLFSPQVISAIRETYTQKGHTFLFAARRGLAPVVACVDCGYIFRSPDTGAPYSLVRIRRRTGEERWFVCSSSGRRERAADVCTICGSWRLRERGIGIQHVHDELTKLVPEIPIILFDHTTARTFKKAQFLKEKFYSTKGAVMLGTQMALPYLTKTLETSIVVSMDSLNATPTWRLHEENLAFLLRLRERTSGTLYVQMRTDEDDVVDLAQKGLVEKFYDGELELRKMFNYPPYTVFVHLTWQGSRDVVADIESAVETALASYGVALYGAPPTPKGLYIRYGLIRIAAPDWPDRKLTETLRALPPSVRTVINPDRIV